MSTRRRPDLPGQDGPEAILNAGIAHIVAEGFTTLTLRPLASRAGVSVGSISHYMGAKDQLLARIVAHAHELDRVFFGPWLERGATLGKAPHPFRAALVDEAFTAWLGHAFDRAVLYSELVSAKSLPDEVRAAFLAWTDLHREIWTALAADEHAGILLAASLADEAAFSLSQHGNTAYLCLRRLCLGRLLQGPERGPEVREATLRLFRRLQAELAPAHSVVGAVADEQPAKKQAIAKAAGQVIVEGGVEAVTHRAVASVAGTPASTVVYHFGARETLVEAGLEAIIRHFHFWRDASRTNPASDQEMNYYRSTEDLVRATHAVAVGAVRFPALAGHAADMRRRRGENIRVDAFSPTAGLTPDMYDPLSAQALSVVIFGARMLAMSLGQDQHEAVSAASAALAKRWTVA